MQGSPLASKQLYLTFEIQIHDYKLNFPSHLGVSAPNRGWDSNALPHD